MMRSYIKHQQKHKQKGAVSAIVVFILIVVISAMLITSLNMSSSTLSDQNQNRDAIKALFAAESAIERAKYILKNDTGNCDPAKLVEGIVFDYSNTTTTISFEIVNAVADSPLAGDCTIKVKGKSNDIVRYLDITLVNIGGTGGPAVADYQFPVEHFDFATWVPWTQVNTTQIGTTSATNVDIEDCPTATCVISTATVGAYNIHTESKQANIVGYIEKAVSISIGATARSGTADIGMKYLATTVGGNSPHITKLDLVDSTGSTATLNLITENKKNITIWTAHATAITYPANAIYDRVRISYDLTQANKVGTVDVWVDEVDIFIQGIAGGSAPDWNVTTWEEIDVWP